ncbi:MAG: hypothetical protein JST19_17400 [Bacteroidetes bacterium]|nr:hypothetical protein [Bacteroidota bacterium]
MKNQAQKLTVKTKTLFKFQQPERLSSPITDPTTITILTNTTRIAGSPFQKK